MSFLHRSSIHCRRLVGKLFSTQAANAAVSLKASTFTGQPSFYETLYLLDDILIRTAPLRPPPDMSFTSASASSKKSVAPQLLPPTYIWRSRERMADALQFPLTALQFRRIRERLNQLADLAPLIPELADFLRIFAASSSSSTGDKDGDGMPVEERRLGRIDALGRVVAIGRRKSSSAKVTLKDGGNGAFTVNGRPLVTYFPRTRDRVQCGRPFEVTNTYGRFDATCVTSGGGHTGIDLASMSRPRRIHMPRRCQGNRHGRPIAHACPPPSRPSTPRSTPRRAEEVWPREGEEKVHLVRPRVASSLYLYRVKR